MCRALRRTQVSFCPFIDTVRVSRVSVNVSYGSDARNGGWARLGCPYRNQREEKTSEFCVDSLGVTSSPVRAAVNVKEVGALKLHVHSHQCRHSQHEEKCAEYRTALPL